MRYIQLQGLLQQKMNELERVHLRERELLEGKWKTHSLPARKKANANTSPSDPEGISPTESSANEGGFYRPALSTEDVPNMTMRQQPVIIPPPAQFMLTYHYLDPTYRYVLRPDNYIEAGMGGVGGGGLQRSSSTDQQLLQQHHQQQQQHQHQHQHQQQQLYLVQRTESLDTNSASQATASTTQQYHSASAGSTVKPPAPPPRTCEKHKPPAKPPKLEKQKHCHAGHSCNPCVGHFRWKSSEKSQPNNGNGNGNGGAGADNVSLDAYDLASPCCDTQCVPSRRRHRQHKEHVHKHKHRDRERSEVKDKHGTPRAKSQTHASPSAQLTGKGAEARQSSSGNPHHHHHHHRHTHEQTPPGSQPHHHYHHPSQTGSVRSRYFDLASGLASHCSLHSCTSSEFAPGDSASYTTSISTDTLFWDPKSEAAQSSRQHSTKSRQSYEPGQGQGQAQPHQQAHPQAHPHVHAHHHHQPHQHYHLTATQVQPSQIYPNTMAYVQKPKSWDNLATKALVGQGFGYGYLDTVAMKSPPVKLQIAQQRHSMPRRNPYGRYSTYGDVENYAPPPTEFVGELTTTTTTTITAKSTEELLAACDCLTPQQQQALKAAQYQLSQNQKLSHQNSCQMGYYSHLPRPTTDVGISTVQGIQQQQQQQQVNNGCDVATVSEATRL